jgi:hypothetical protein
MLIPPSPKRSFLCLLGVVEKRHLVSDRCVMSSPEPLRAEMSRYSCPLASPSKCRRFPSGAIMGACEICELWRSSVGTLPYSVREIQNVLRHNSGHRTADSVRNLTRAFWIQTNSNHNITTEQTHVYPCCYRLLHLTDNSNKIRYRKQIMQLLITQFYPFFYVMFPRY